MTENLKPILTRHVKEVINCLISNSVHFCIQCVGDKVSFEPSLPHEIAKHFNPIIDFILSGYTFDSIEIWEDDISFEAGFGPSNFSSIVIIPFSSIIQISVPLSNSTVRDVCVFMNAMNFLELDIFQNPNEDLDEMDLIDDSDMMNNSVNAEDSRLNDLIESSKHAILSNPKNKF